MLSLSLNICLYGQIRALEAFYCSVYLALTFHLGLLNVMPSWDATSSSKSNAHPHSTLPASLIMMRSRSLWLSSIPVLLPSLETAWIMTQKRPNRSQGNPHTGAAAQHPPPHTPHFSFAPALSQRDAVRHTICNHSRDCWRVKAVCFQISTGSQLISVLISYLQSSVICIYLALSLVRHPKSPGENGVAEGKQEHPQAGTRKALFISKMQTAAQALKHSFLHYICTSGTKGQSLVPARR